MTEVSYILPSQVARPSRADARRNFDRLVAAADAVFAEQGVDAPIDDIAKRAGVGSATLYRHFPSRDALVGAVIWERIGAVCRQGTELLEVEPPVRALTSWLRAVIDLTMRRGLAAALIASKWNDVSELFDACHHALEETAALLLERAQRDGSIRPDLSLTDVLTFANAIASGVAQSPDRDERADRMLRLLLEGLMTGNPGIRHSPEPGAD
jgi:AcrR family transcriptional regulator